MKRVEVKENEKTRVDPLYIWDADLRKRSKKVAYNDSSIHYLLLQSCS